jgi:hypothetical protein
VRDPRARRSVNGARRLPGDVAFEIFTGLAPATDCVLLAHSSQLCLALFIAGGFSVAFDAAVDPGDGLLSLRLWFRPRPLRQ